MIKVITVFYPRSLNLDVWLYHLLEHCLVKKIQTNLELYNFSNRGIIINAETFLDGFFIELIYSSNEVTDGLFKIIEDSIHFESSDIEIIKKEMKIIKSEVSNIDLTEEEESLYSPLNNCMGLNIYDLYGYEEKYNINTLINIFNSLDQRITYTNEGVLKFIKNCKLESLSLNNSTNFNQHNGYLVNYIYKENCNLLEYVLMSFLSFILGKSDISLLDKHYLSKNNIYLGYTHDVIPFNTFVILILTEYSDDKSIEELTSNKVLSFINENFDMYKNAFKTFFLLYMNLTTISKEIIKLNLNFEEISYNQIIDIIDNIDIYIFKNFIDMQLFCP